MERLDAGGGLKEVIMLLEAAEIIVRRGCAFLRDPLRCIDTSCTQRFNLCRLDANDASAFCKHSSVL